MNEAHSSNEHSGSLTRAVAPALEPVTVACAHWDADVDPASCSTGSLRRTTQTQPALNCVFQPVPVTLEIAICLDSAIDPGQAFVLAAELLSAVLMHDLGHGLHCTATQSAVKQGEVILLLTPKAADADVEARLLQLSELIRQTADATHGIAANEVRVRFAA